MAQEQQMQNQSTLTDDVLEEMLGLNKSEQEGDERPSYGEPTPTVDAFDEQPASTPILHDPGPPSPCELCDDQLRIANDLPCPKCCPDGVLPVQPPQTIEEQLVGTTTLPLPVLSQALEQLVQTKVDERFDKFQADINVDINNAIDAGKATLMKEWADVASQLMDRSEAQIKDGTAAAITKLQNDAIGRVGGFLGEVRQALRALTATADKYKMHINLAGERLLAYDANLTTVKDAMASAEAEVKKARDALTANDSATARHVERLTKHEQTVYNVSKKLDSVLSELRALRGSVTEAFAAKK